MGSDLLNQMHIKIEKLIDNEPMNNCDSNKLESEKDKQNNTNTLFKYKKDFKSRKSLKLNELSNYLIEIKNNNNILENSHKRVEKNEIDRRIEELDKKLQLLNENASKKKKLINKNYNDDNDDDDDDDDDNIYNIDITPKRSCLSRKVSKNILEASFSTSSDNLKKRVSFADLHGKDLISIKTMSEPSDCPPKLKSKYVRFFLKRDFFNDTLTMSNDKENETQDLYKIHSNLSITIYTLNFEQPAADYLKFQEKIRFNNLSLENVIINCFHVTGTIKVKNLCYKKSVFVRCTFDGWKSFNDYNAVYLPNIYSSCDENQISSVVDTFKFEFLLPYNTNVDNAIKITIDKFNVKKTNHKSHEYTQSDIQFCVCFKSDINNNEYWDSNNGKNYSILPYLITLDTKYHFNNKILNSDKEADLENKLNHINSNYLQLLIQEKNLNTFIDNFFYNCIYNNNNNNSLNDYNDYKSCSNIYSWSNNCDVDFNIPYW